MTADGTKLKFTAKKDGGTYYEYKGGLVDYYEFNKRKLYSSNKEDFDCIKLVKVT